MGTDWRNIPEPESVPKDRVQLQQELDTDYGMGRITREQWSNEFDRLSDPEWNAKRSLSIQMLKRAAAKKKQSVSKSKRLH
jgi:hypothetical protein